MVRRLLCRCRFVGRFRLLRYKPAGLLLSVGGIGLLNNPCSIEAPSQEAFLLLSAARELVVQTIGQLLI